ncbi:MAG: aminopeptidase [SAR86 cluster bacterium]|uniref:Aminopeptidase n=1 Tax=SAR86 cluster bacterium TaxID=2030880 RepID=A0A2A5CGE1_9GAMM|nr:MAG: aminopeptidase [SAR86 cluster bacterium]
MVLPGMLTMSGFLLRVNSGPVCMKLKCSNKLFILSLCLFLAGCESISYYSQAILGQLSILSKREAIEDLIADDRSSPELKSKLSTILDIRAFAESEMLLPVEDNYDSYVDVDRPFVVWNVFAAAEFSMTPHNWCYPIAGCVSYRGYFAEADAQRYAARLDDDGLDVYVGGVSAYSTLGWFSDPVLSTIINRDDYQLAALLFHELAHQLIYIPGDTEFNESFATAIEREGLRRWLAASNVDAAESHNIVQLAQLNTQRREEFVALVAAVVSELDTIYASDSSEDFKRQAKAEVFTEMQSDYAALKNNWNGYDGYDAWMSRELNNAQLNTVATYFNWVPAFEQILADNEYDLTRFYTEISVLSELDSNERSCILSSKIN